VERERVEELALVGDAFGVPLLAELDRAAAEGRPYDLASLRRVVSSGVRWSPEVKRRLLRAGRMTLQDSIAATEGGPYGISLVGPDPDSVTSRFTLPPNARVIGPDGRDVVPGSGQVGVLACTGPLPLGYLDAPDLTAAVFQEIDGVRHAVPGDAATIEADGSLTLLGRGAGVINTGGEKVFAEEVEEVLVGHAGVAEAVVVGLPDDRWGSRVTALVVPEAGAQLLEEELADYVGQRLAGYKRPRSVFVVGEVERTVSGKIDRRRALERAVGLTESVRPPPDG
jgi:fatty-acyl-CoA synthase